MASATDAPVDLYIAAYPDATAAQADWAAIKQLAKDDVINVDGLILVSRRADGKIHVDDDFHETRKGATWGAVGGAVVGLIFPPAILASAAVGAGIGAGAGALVSHGRKEEIKADVDDTLPLNSSGIVAIFEEQWEDDIDKALSNAGNVTKEKVDPESADQVKGAATENQPTA
ncbi:MAG: DUF1269 domain-containing protein [Gaiellaceae bacterium]